MWERPRHCLLLVFGTDRNSQQDLPTCPNFSEDLLQEETELLEIADG
jgi:hypothetical protein